MIVRLNVGYVISRESNRIDILIQLKKIPNLSSSKIICRSKTQDTMKAHLKFHIPNASRFAIHFQNFSNLMRSEKINISNLESFAVQRNSICELCGKAFKNDSVLSLHRQATHSTERPFECEICGLRYIFSNRILSLSVAQFVSHFQIET